MEDLKTSIAQYNDQLSMVNEALAAVQDATERESLLALQSELKELLHLTQESLDTLTTKEESSNDAEEQTDAQKILKNAEKPELDDEYALFMQEMAKSGAYDENEGEKPKCSEDVSKTEEDEDIEDELATLLGMKCAVYHTHKWEGQPCLYNAMVSEVVPRQIDCITDELATLLGMKCAVYHTHKWGGQPCLYNAMVSEVVPRQDDDQFSDLQVRVLFTHPTHAEMLPCPFYLDGECRFEDEKCRYSHGDVVPLSSLKDAIDPNFESIRVGSRILLKLKPPDGEEISLTKKSSEKYHLWHRAVIKSIDLENKTCLAKLENGVKTGEKRKSGTDECHVKFEDIFPLNTESDDSSDSDGSISDTEYPESKTVRSEVVNEGRALLIEKSLQSNAPAMGEWERHTRGIGSKLMLAMGYVPGSGLGAAGEGRVQPVEARVLPVGKSLDTCMAISEKMAAQDPLKVEQKLKRMQKKEEERNKRAYEREKERERRNVFNFLNRTLGNQDDESSSGSTTVDIKQSTSKDLNIEQFKLTEDTKRLEKEIVKLNSSLTRYPQGSPGHRTINIQIQEKNKELQALRSKEQQISKEQRHRKDKQKMTVF